MDGRLWPVSPSLSHLPCSRQESIQVSLGRTQEGIYLGETC